MKCVDAQQTIWIGDHTEELEEHVRMCAACSREMQLFHKVSDLFSSDAIPNPSKSLIPSRNVIRQQIKRNRRIPLLRGASVAAAVALLFGSSIPLALKLHHNEGFAVDPNRSKPMQNEFTQIAAQTYTLSIPKDWKVSLDQDTLSFSKNGTEIGGILPEGAKGGNVYPPNQSVITSQKHLTGFFTDVLQMNLDRSQPAASNAPTIAKETRFYFLLPDGNSAYDMWFKDDQVSSDLMMQIAQSLKPTGNSTSTVEVAANVSSEYADVIKSYYSKIVDPAYYKHVLITDLSPSSQNPGKTVVKVTAQVQLVPNAVQNPDFPTRFSAGNDVKYVLLSSINGSLMVQGIGSKPDAFSSFSPDVQGVQKIEGTITDFQIDPIDANWRMMIYVTIKIEKNYTTANGPLQAGKTVRIDFAQKVPVQGQGHFELSKGQRLFIQAAPSDPAYTAGEVNWVCTNLNNFLYQKGGKYYNWLGYPTAPF